MRHQAIFARSAVVFLALVGAGCFSGGVTAPTVASGGSVAPMAPVAGRVMFPATLGNNAHIIPTGIGAVISGNAGRYSTLAINPDVPAPANVPEVEWAISGAVIVLGDPVTHQRLPGVASARTDEQGRFHFDGVPAGMRNVLVEALFRSPDGKQGFRLLALARPGVTSEVQVSWRSTVVVGSLLASSTADVGTMDPTTLKSSEDALAASIVSQSATARLETFTRALGVPATTIPQAEVPTELPVALPSTPFSLPSSVPPGPGLPVGVPSTVVSLLPVSVPALPAVTQGAAGSVPSVVASVISTTPIQSTAGAVVSAASASVAAPGSTVSTLLDAHPLASRVPVTVGTPARTPATIVAPLPLPSVLSLLP